MSQEGAGEEDEEAGIELPAMCAAACCSRSRRVRPRAAPLPWSCPPAARPLPPRLRTRAGRPAAAAPLRRADMGGRERGLRAVATSGGLATSVRVVVGGGGGRGGRRSGARPPGAAPEAGIEREKGERAGRARGRLGSREMGGTERADGLNHDSRSRVNIWSDSIFGFVRVFGYRPPKPDLPEIISGTVTYYPK